MTVVTGIGQGTGAVSLAFIPDLYYSTPAVSAADSNGFTVTTLTSDGTVTAVLTGSGLTYPSGGGLPTGGTITGLQFTHGPNSQTWSGFNVSAAALSTVVTTFDSAGFFNLFFSGADSFTFTSYSQSTGFSTPSFGGDDVFNISGWDVGPGYIIDGSTEIDTLNIIGGIGSNYLFNSPVELNLSIQTTNFRVTNVETVNLAAGSNYLIFAGANMVQAGQSIKINASALGSSNRLIFNTNVTGAATNTGSLTLTGGAGDDWFQPVAGSSSFDGGAGTDTIDFTNFGAVTVNLGNYPHTFFFSSSSATGALINIENIIGTSQNDSIIGSFGNNALTGGGGNDTIDGNAGWDLAIFSGNYASYTINAIGHFQYTVTGPDGSDTLTNVEELVFADRTVAVGNASAPFNFSGPFGYHVSDILWQNDNGQAAIWRMKTSGPDTSILDQAQIGSNPGPSWHIKGAGDFDGDGSADILWQNDGGQPQIWFMGTGFPGGPLIVRNTALAGSNPGSSWHVMDSGDFNGDGRSDILWQNDIGQAAVWLLNGSKLVDSAAIANNPGPTWHIRGTGDFDGDAKSDILWQNDSGQTAIWYMNGTTVTGGVQVIGGSPGAGYQVKGVGDFDGDNKADILWQNNSGMATLWLMNGVGPTNTAGWYVGPGWAIKGTADMNGNARSDILWQSNSGQAVVWMMDGTTVQSQLQIGSNPGASWQIANYGTVTRKVKNDFDGDRKADILWQSDSGQAALWFMSGTTLVNGAAAGSNPGPSWHVKGPGDFDGDGKADILWQNDNGQAALWLMNGATVTGGVAISNNPGPSWHVISSGDFDGDGRSDILWQNDSGQVALWFMDGANFTSGAVVGNPGPSWHVKGSGDFNGDRKSDILWQNDSGQAMLWLMDGSTVTSGNLWIGSNPGTSWHVKGAGDFDGDGRSDVLWQNDNGQAVIWTMNGGLLLNSAAVGSNPGPSWQVKGTSDLNGDGMSDILWQSTAGQAVGWLMSGTNVLSSAVLGSNPGTGWHVIAAGN
jgi:hypothetical protein